MLIPKNSHFSIKLFFFFLLFICLSTGCEKEESETSTEPAKLSQLEIQGRLEIYKSVTSEIHPSITEKTAVINGRILNTGIQTAGNIYLSPSFYDSSGQEMSLWGFPRLYNNNSNKIAPNEYGWFSIRIEGEESHLVDSVTYALSWDDVSDSTPANEFFDQIETEVDVLYENSRLNLNLSLTNNSLENLIPSFIGLAALDQDDEIIHIFRIEYFMPRRHYCYNGENVQRSFFADQVLSFDQSFTYEDFPLNQVKRWEARIYTTNSCQNIAPVSGDVIYNLSSQENGNNGCASFQRVQGEDKVTFFHGCGFGSGFRGINVAIINGTDGTIQDFRTFDTYAYASYSDNLVNYLSNIPDNCIILMTVADSATKELTDEAKQLIAEAFGSELIFDLSYRDGFNLAYINGSEPILIEELSDYSENNNVFQHLKTEVAVQIPLE